MAFYENTIVAKQDLAEKDLKTIKDKYNEVINKSSELIKNNGKLILEVAFDQKSKVKNLLKEKGFYINRVLKDLSNNDRCIISSKI